MERRKVNPKRTIRFFGARANNLKNIDVEIPLGMMVAVTGVSGSGKSSLVHDVIYRALDLHVNKERQAAECEEREARRQRPQAPAETRGARRSADQRRDGGSVAHRPHAALESSHLRQGVRSHPRSLRLHSGSGAARLHGGHFSFNIPGGRCETCQGDGTVTVEMQFLADVELVCEECKGTRYKQSVLDIRYKGLNIHEVLQLTVREALSFFADSPRLAARLKVLNDVGLGYLRLGQSATTLSGGEAQRVKLAAHLAQSTCEGTLFLFDEPTTGLHFDDIAKLLQAFERLIQNGGSILVIEHNLDLIQAADWVIDLGPEGGEAGGRIVAQGTPEAIAQVPESYTGQVS